MSTTNNFEVGKTYRTAGGNNTVLIERVYDTESGSIVGYVSDTDGLRIIYSASGFPTGGGHEAYQMLPGQSL